MNNYIYASSRQYPVKTIIDADCTDDVVLLKNTSVQAECLLHSLEQAARGIGPLWELKQNRIHDLNNMEPSPH